MTPRPLIVWDFETVPDLAATARIHGTEEANEEKARDELGDKFPKLPLHKIACIGAPIAEWRNHSWNVRSLGAPHIGERSENELIRSFVNKIAELRPQLITYNGNSFDLPALRYRAQSLGADVAAFRYGGTMQEFVSVYTDQLMLCDNLDECTARAEVQKLLGLSL